MKFPCELVVWRILPAIRAKLAVKLKEKGLNQKEVAEILDVSEPAVSQYLSGKRAADFKLNKSYDKEFEDAANNIDSKLKFMTKACLICKDIRKSGEACRICKEVSEVPKGCGLCLE